MLLPGDLKKGPMSQGPSKKQTDQVRQIGCLVLGNDRGVTELASMNKITVSDPLE